ncbi:MAG TPA: hypothetical protein VMP68_17510 [Candidatus Eisenbacteria bacterium]|nr:hypothetical protein [Candidatus Eisenbacteria bacterium]
MPGETRQSIIDEEHLKMLSLGYLVSAGVSAFYSLFGLIYVFMGIMMNTNRFPSPPAPANPAQAPPPAFVGWILAFVGVAFFVLAMAVSAARFRAAWCIKHRKWRVFCMVIAGIGCLEFPYGTVLGIFSFLVLGRDSVVQLFSSRPPVDSLVEG